MPKETLPVKLPENIDLNVKGNPLDRQEEWKKIPHSSSSNEIWNRFRLACNTFFNARKENFKKVIKLEEEASNKKKKIVNKLKKLNLSESPKNTLEELDVIKLEWKNTGKVTKRDKSTNDEFRKFQ